MKKVKRLSKRGLTIETTNRVYHSYFMRKKVQKMSKRWHNLYLDGARLDRIIRRLEKKLKKTEDDEKIIKLANSITYVTSKKMELADMVLGVEAVVKAGKKEHKLGSYRDRLELVNQEPKI